ncbi:HD domain-containing protein [Clostridium sp.]|uniref:HD domain-containing protein n=1 Tax=Clostridium sp. TaxID=1506 RepID=UPI002634CE37|nr:HD domain-containing protein [Clostridium sp.]
MIKIFKDKSKRLKSGESLFIDLGGYNPSTVTKIKTLSKRVWIPENKLWEVPLSLIKDIIDLFDISELKVDENIDLDYIEPEPIVIVSDNKNVEDFKNELDLINDNKIKEWTLKALESLPDYFFEIPASSTGKYHPKYCLGEGGLTRHCRAAAKIAKDMFTFSTLFKFTSKEEDEIISALLLHDGCKNGLEGSKYTIHEHPLVVCEYLKDNKELNKILDKETRDNILNNIQSHMSEWNINKRSNIVLPLPQTDSQKFTALCDYLASRKDINVAI